MKKAAIGLLFFLGLGILPVYVPMDKIPQYWTHSSHHYLQATNIQPGWAWLGKLNYGDFLVYLPIVFLAGITIVCYIGVLFKFIKSKENVLVVIAIAEIVVLLAAASGFLNVGH